MGTFALGVVGRASHAVARLRHTGPVRLTDFWERMDAVFGAAYSRSWARDYSLADIGGLTVMQAIDRGVETREIWDAVCAVVDVPGLLR